MQIQRIQSIYLLIAAVLMAVMCLFVPVATLSDINGNEFVMRVLDIPQLLILDALAAILLFINIFLFKNLRLQMKVTRISIVIIIFSMLIEAYVCLTFFENAIIHWTAPACVMAAAVIFSALALAGMRRDYKLLSSYDRLR